MSDFFAQPPLHPQYADMFRNIPAGFRPLANGADGELFISNNGMVVRKHCFNAWIAEKEWSILQLLMRIAPSYLPAPARLAREGEAYVLEMMNAGNCIARGTHLTQSELCLCVLQTLHFVLLVSPYVKMRDMHSGNMCTRMRGSHIEMRWIDFSEWQMEDSSSSHVYALENNAHEALNTFAELGVVDRAFLDNFTPRYKSRKGDQGLAMRAVCDMLISLALRIFDTMHHAQDDLTRAMTLMTSISDACTPLLAAAQRPPG
jgi:hypothetical protein